MRILLTNDDGIAAEGLEALGRIAASLSDDVWICAPEQEQSGASRALTLSQPVRVRSLGARSFAVSGTPTDCVRLALSQLIPGPRPDLVLSGVNRGQNLGEDVTMSGTVAGAIEGMMWGVPSIALSQSLEVFHDERVARFQTAEDHAPGVIARLIQLGWPADVLININFPDRPSAEVQEVEVTSQGRHDMSGLTTDRRTDLRGRDYYWMGFAGREVVLEPGSDLAAIAEGRISVTPLHINLTHRQTMTRLKSQLGGAAPKLKPAHG